MKKVYLAGKIKSFGWRNEIFPSIPDIADCENVSLPVNNNLLYCGPFFNDWNHGEIRDGKGEHGIIQEGWKDAEYSEQGEVFWKCLEWVESADLLFAWIDNSDCFGTVFEVAYASAFNIPIFVAFDKRLPKSTQEDMWFISQSSFWDVEEWNNAFEAWSSFVNLSIDVSDYKVQPKSRNIYGNVYVLRSKYGFKIGKSSRLNDRMKLFGVKLPFEFNVALVLQTGMMNELESSLHRLFAHKKINGEWYNLDESDLKTIRLLGESQVQRTGMNFK